jgi:flagellar hook assembly protein FlgD
MLPIKSRVRLEISTLQGQFVNAFSFQAEANTEHHIPWNGRDINGKPIPAGVYLGRLSAGDQTYFVKLIHIN